MFLTGLIQASGKSHLYPFCGNGVKHMCYSLFQLRQKKSPKWVCCLMISALHCWIFPVEHFIAEIWGDIWAKIENFLASVSSILMSFQTRMIFFLLPNTKGSVRKNIQVLGRMFLLLFPYNGSEWWQGDLKLQKTFWPKLSKHINSNYSPDN